MLSQPLAQGDPTLVTAVRDISQRKAQDARIERMARHDGLTDLLNRTAFHEDVAARLARDGTGTLVLIDLDRFKPVNDTHGHPVGDRVLRVLADRFAAEIRHDDILARLGGDEFAVFVGRPEHAEALGARLAEVAAREISIDDTDANGADENELGRTVCVGASLGIAAFPDDAHDLDTLLVHADAALYRAKNGGRGRVCRYDPRLHAFAEERARMADDLREAVHADGLGVAYQPIFDVGSGATIALEALVRWEHPHHGEVEPDLFLPLAEEARLLPRLGLFVMRRAFRTARETGLRMCVNVAPQQLADPDFLRDVDAAVAEAGIEASRVELEVTERVLRSEEPLILETLHALAGRGFAIALDDFGTGPSSLASLHHYPFGRIKLDGGFLRSLDPKRAPALLAALLQLARVQKLSVTAEGIESHSELALMTRLGLDAVQGYLLARPGDVDTVPRRLDEAA